MVVVEGCEGAVDSSEMTTVMQRSAFGLHERGEALREPKGSFGSSSELKGVLQQQPVAVEILLLA